MDDRSKEVKGGLAVPKGSNQRICLFSCFNFNNKDFVFFCVFSIFALVFFLLKGRYRHNFKKHVHLSKENKYFRIFKNAFDIKYSITSAVLRLFRR